MKRKCLIVLISLLFLLSSLPLHLIGEVLILGGEFKGAEGIEAMVFRQGAPSGLAVSLAGDLLITDLKGKVLWSLPIDGSRGRDAGREGIITFGGEVFGGYHDGRPLESAFRSPWDITPYLDGFLMSDTENNAVRYIADDQVYTAFGIGLPGSGEGVGVGSRLNRPTGLATDPAGNVYIADTGNHLIRKVTPAGVLTTYAGTAEGYIDGRANLSAFSSPTGLYWRNGALYVADSGNHRIRMIVDGVVSTVAGTVNAANDDEVHEGGYFDSIVTRAKFSNPQGLAVEADGTIYVADTGNSAIRRIQGGQVLTLAVGDPSAGEAYPSSPRGMLLYGDYLYVADTFAGTVFSLKPTTLLGDLVNNDARYYIDVAENHWAYSPVQFVTAEGLFAGTGRKVFSPQMTASRGMFVTVLSRLHRMVQPGATIAGGTVYADVNSAAYYAKATAWAGSLGLAKGAVQNNFFPETAISRETMATILFAYTSMIGGDTSGSENTPLDAFVDKDQISPEALPALRWAVHQGIMAGTGNGVLDPLGESTRAQMAAIFGKYWQFMQGTR